MEKPAADEAGAGERERSGPEAKSAVDGPVCASEN